MVVFSFPGSGLIGLVTFSIENQTRLVNRISIQIDLFIEFFHPV
jgi:hypothetical protein